MSYAGVRDGLISTIVGGGRWSGSQVSGCDFGIMELSASVVVLYPGNSTIKPMTFQSTASAREKEVTWEFGGMVLVKDPGNVQTWLANLWTAVDDIFTSVNRDDSLNGKAAAAYISQISRPDPDTFYRLNSIDYAPIRFTVRATEFV